MMIYWLMFLIPVCAALMPGRLKPSHAWLPWSLVYGLFTAVIGLRHEVGGDWFNYLDHFDSVAYLSLPDILAHSDPGYFLVNWLVSNAGGDIYYVNLICAAVTVAGTLVFARAQPNPWLALLVAVPYMLLVVAMGYTRQAVALGFGLLGLVALSHRRTRAFVLWVAIGATFHKSAVLLLPVAALAASRNRWLTIFIVAITTVLLYYLLLADSAEALWKNYVEADYQSDGGLVRVLMNVVPATFLVLFRRKLAPDVSERKLWLWMAAFSFLCWPLVMVSSTAVDRVALYLIPIQMFVFARLPRLAGTSQVRTPLVLAIIAYYFATQYVWLNYAFNAWAWVPYRFMPIS
jgi:hypothetical protein